MDRYSKHRKITVAWQTIATNNACSYSNIEPAIFEVGDIVEASFAFVTLPIKGGQYVMILQLRGLLLLDNSLCIHLVKYSNPPPLSFYFCNDVHKANRTKEKPRMCHIPCASSWDS